MQGPEGRPPNVSPARKGWEIDPEDDPSAVGAALNRSSALPVPLAALPTCPGLPWRDLRFCGSLMEMFLDKEQQICHLDRTRISCHAALDMAACAAFVKESSMKCANAIKFHRKSGGA